MWNYSCSIKGFRAKVGGIGVLLGRYRLITINEKKYRLSAIDGDVTDWELNLEAKSKTSN